MNKITITTTKIITTTTSAHTLAQYKTSAAQRVRIHTVRSTGVRDEVRANEIVRALYRAAWISHNSIFRSLYITNKDYEDEIP